MNTDRYEQQTRRERGSATRGEDTAYRSPVAATRLQVRGAADRLEQLRELDGQIMQNADDLTRRIQRREKPAALSVIANLLRSMFERRAYLLGELNKAGISEAEAYREIRKPR